MADDSAIAAAVRLYEDRRRRADISKGARLNEPSSDLLLFLFIHQKRRVTVTETCIGTASPRTTGLRHIEEMNSLGYVEYQDSPYDRRTRHVSLSEMANSLTRAYLASGR